MFSTLSRSWSLTKTSFRVIGQDKEMLLFPLLAGIFSVLFSVALLYPTILVQMGGDGKGVTLTMVEYAVLFVTYLGLAFIATFFNVCVVFTTKTRFEGGDATFADSIKFALSRIVQIFAWSLVAATVGMVLRGLDQMAERAGGVGKIVIGILASLLGMMWTIVTLFVVPAMVYDGLGPIAAIKRSVETLKSTWGESLARHYGLGFIHFLFILLGIVLAIGLFAGLGGMGGVGFAIALGVVVFYFLAVILTFNVANAVFSTALYAYANGRRVPGYDDDMLQQAFRLR